MTIYTWTISVSKLFANDGRVIRRCRVAKSECYFHSLRSAERCARNALTSIQKGKEPRRADWVNREYELLDPEISIHEIESHYCIIKPHNGPPEIHSWTDMVIGKCLKNHLTASQAHDFIVNYHTNGGK